MFKLPKIINEIGNTYGNLKVIEQAPSINGRRYWKCQCQICKRIEIISGTRLRNNSKKCCDNIKQHYGDLTIEEYAFTSKDRHIYYRCKCACGNKENIKGTLLFTGKQTKCSICSKSPAHNFIDETGNIYHNLTVLERNFDIKQKEAYWKCRCSCGNIITVQGSKLRNGHTTSCGCINSKGEMAIIKLLNDNNIKYQTQIKIPGCEYKNLLRFDFGIYNDEKLIYLIEYDGIQHYRADSGWITDDKFKEIKIRDDIKNSFCKEQKIPLIRIPYKHLEKLSIDDLLLDKTKFLIN